MTKQTTSDLEQRACAALTTDIDAATLDALIGEVTAGIDTAEHQAASERDRAMDPTVSPDPKLARETMENAIFAAGRLRSILPRLQTRLANQQQAEQMQRRQERGEQLQAARDTLSTELREKCLQFASFADTFARAEALDNEIRDFNIGSFPGEPHIDSVELHARGLTGFSRATPSILKTCVLPVWEHTSAVYWPPKRAPLAAHYGLGVAPDEHYGPNWWKAVAADNERKLGDAQRREAEEQQRQQQARERYEANLAERTPPPEAA